MYSLVHKGLNVLKVGICVEGIEERQHSLKHHLVLLLKYRTHNSTVIVQSKEIERMIQYRLAEILCQGKFSPNQVVVAKTFHQIYFTNLSLLKLPLTAFRTVTFHGGLHWYLDGFHWEVLATCWPWSYLYAAGDILNCYIHFKDNRCT